MKKGIYFSFDKVGGIERLIEEKPTAARIFLFLSKYSNDDNVVVALSSVLETALKKTRPYLAKCVKYLKDNGYLAVINSGQTSVYIFNNDILISNKYDNEYKNIEVLNATLFLSPKESIAKNKQRQTFNEKV
ncbi:hypothetical protein [Fastidiosibacter lacustris]|uniref:hypothetical protein n=1 Tax=Fastidiosibacter lacustris TaxID=2056695 RepID=UPI000E341803|nr:hypothetical protein [Fastidiosibacter lacustris]